MMTIIPAVPAAELAPIPAPARVILLQNQAGRLVRRQQSAEKPAIITASQAVPIPAPARVILLQNQAGRLVRQRLFAEKPVIITANPAVPILAPARDILLHNPVGRLVRQRLFAVRPVIITAEAVLVMTGRIAQKIPVLLLPVHAARHLAVSSLHVVHMINLIKAVSPGFLGETV